MSEIKEKLKELKEQRIEEILNSSESKGNKLKALADEQLWYIDGYVIDPFTDWQNELQEQLGEKWLICDERFLYNTEWIQRHETIYLHNCFEDYDENSDEEVVVFTTRGEKQVSYMRPVKEVLDRVYEYAIKNKIVGFQMDW